MKRKQLLALRRCCAACIRTGGTCRKASGYGSKLQAGRSLVRDPEVKILIYLVLPAALAPGVYSASNTEEVRPVHGADNLTAICEPTFYIMLEHQLLTRLQASTACYGDSFTLLCI
jgi:hypothetical protein